MDFRWFGFLTFVFVGLTILNQILGGAFISTTDIQTLNQIAITQQVQTGPFILTVPNVGFLSGLLHLARWDYSYFGGMAQLLVFFLYSITGMICIFLFITTLGLAINAIRPR